MYIYKSLDKTYRRFSTAQDDRVRDYFFSADLIFNLKITSKKKIYIFKTISILRKILKNTQCQG